MFKYLAIAANTLGKNERLKSRKLITELFKSGKAFNVFPFRVVYSIVEGAGVQAGFSVSTRNFKRAVDRNRIKRLTREGYRIRKSVLAEILQKKGKKLVFFFIFTGKELPEPDFIENKISVIIEKLAKIVDESAT